MVKLLTFPCVRYSGHEMYVTITRIIIIIIIIEVHRLFSPGGGGGGGFAGSVCCGGGGGLGTDGDGAIALAVACSSLLGPTFCLECCGMPVAKVGSNAKLEQKGTELNATRE